MKKEELRPVTFKLNYERMERNKGWFHCTTEMSWSADDGKSIAKKYAMVEDESGQMRTVPFDLVKFEDR